MPLERTLSLVKPDAFAAGHAPAILAAIAGAGLRVVATRTLRLSRTQAEGFYAVHRVRPFFASLVEFMTSGPIQASVLEGEDAIRRYRDLMGPTDSRKAEPGTLRHAYGTDIEKNAVHGSDGADTASFEIAFLFSGADLV